MSSSYSFTDSVTFTITHARHIAARVATDLKRIQRFYGRPDDASIAAYETEVIELLRAGYLGKVGFGFKRGDRWIEPTLHYSARELAGGSANDDDPGRIQPGADISGASFYSYLTYSSAWDRLSSSEQQAFKAKLPIQRTGAEAPGAAGYFINDRTYSAGGIALDRMSLKSFR
jgi:hypothetical protein